MTEKFELDQVREFWPTQAIQHQESPSASWSDRMVIEMEIREMSRQARCLETACSMSGAPMAIRRSATPDEGDRDPRRRLHPRNDRPRQGPTR